MEAQNLQRYLEAELEFPTDQQTILDDIGETEIDAPDGDTSMTIGEILEPIHEDSYETSDELREIIMTNLPEEYVGRSRYSDRGPEGDRPAGGNTQNREQESF